jgi:hypothetical protein
MKFIHRFSASLEVAIRNSDAGMTWLQLKQVEHIGKRVVVNVQINVIVAI